MTTIDDILAAAEALPTSDRARLLGLLWERVPPEQWELPSAEWIAEAHRRGEAIDASEMEVEPWDLVRRRARREAGLDD